MRQRVLPLLYLLIHSLMHRLINASFNAAAGFVASSTTLELRCSAALSFVQKCF